MEAATGATLFALIQDKPAPLSRSSQRTPQPAAQRIDEAKRRLIRMA